MSAVTRFYLDTEFIEDGHTIDLLSIGIVAEDGREFYAENRYAMLPRANDWVKEHVLPHLDMVKAGDKQRGGGKTPTEIREGILAFIGDDTPEFWGYYADYDWVVLCQLFGRMVDLPKGWPMFCMDLKQEAVRVGNPPLPEQVSQAHNALADARWNAHVHRWLADHFGST